MTREAAFESILLDVALPQVYIRNAFRDTGLPVDATQKDLARCREHLELAVKLGRAVHSGPLPTDPAASADEVRDALSRLQDPERRLIEELFWFWPVAGPSTSDDALRDLAEGRVEHAVEFWREIRASAGDVGVATHNLAVYAHLVALDMESELASSSKLDERERLTLAEAWKETLDLWAEVLHSNDFWVRLEERIRDVGDPRRATAISSGIRSALPAALLSINAQLALAFAERDMATETLRHRQLMYGSPLGKDGLETALDLVLTPIRTRVKVLREMAAEEADIEPRSGGALAESLLEQTAPLVATLDAVLPDDDPALEAVHDDIALQVVACQTQYAKETNDWDGSIATLERASVFAASESARRRIETDLATAKANAESGVGFCGAGYRDQPKPFVDRMERARRWAGESRWDDAFEILLRLFKRDDLTGEQKALVRNALSFCLDGKALERLNETVEKRNRPPTIIAHIHERAQSNEIDGYTLTVAATGIRDESDSLKCMACGCPIQGQFNRFTYDDVVCIVCEPCDKAKYREAEQRTAELQETIKEVAPDLLFAAELDPGNKGVERNLGHLRELAAQEGVTIPADAFERRVELDLVPITELVEAFTDGGREKRSVAKQGLERDDPELLSRLLAARRGRILRLLGLPSAAAVALVVLYNFVAGIAGFPGPTYRLHRLGLVGLERTVNVLAGAMERGDVDARDKSVERLVEIGAGSIPRMLVALRSESIRARESAASVIVRLGETATPALLAAGSHPDPQIRTAVAAVIGSLGISDRNAQSLLDSLSGDSDEEVVVAARIASRHGNRAIVVGDTLVGRLDPDDLPLAGAGNRDRFVEEWRLLASQGECFTIELTSLDTRMDLAVSGPGLSEPLTNDGAQTPRIRLAVCPPTTGTYQVTAACWACGSAAYALTVDSASEVDIALLSLSSVGSCEAVTDPVGELLLGTPVNGRLTRNDPTCQSWIDRYGRYIQVWTFTAQAGQMVTVDLTSSDVDPYLLVAGPGLGAPLSDDDGGGGRNSRISFSATQAGVFFFAASTYGERDAGSYSIVANVSEQVASSGPSAGGACAEGTQPVGELSPGVLETGRLGGGDPTCLSGSSRTGHYMQRWTFDGIRGQSVTIDMISSDIDPYLILTGPGIPSSRADDDGGNGRNARITLTLPGTGTFSVYASTYSAGENGPYNIRLGEDSATRPSAETDAACVATVTPTGVLRAGETKEGDLGRDDPTCLTAVSRTGRYIDVWTFQGTAGQRVTVDMMSSAVDPYLMIGGPGLPFLQTDDDSGDDRNARIQLALPETGDYTVYASSYSEGSSGSYTIRVTDTARGGGASGSGAACDVIPAVSGTLTPDRDARGEFDDSDPTCMRGFDRTGRYLDLWIVDVEPGRRVTVDMISDDVDAYLALFVSGTDTPITNDDGGNGSNARITAQARAGTQLTIVATSYDERESGSYTLRLRVGGN